jgi:hypothetical protein
LQFEKHADGAITLRHVTDYADILRIDIQLTRLTLAHDQPSTLHATDNA